MENGRIVAIERELAAEAETYDAQGRLACSWLDRDPYPSRQVAHHRALRAAGAQPSSSPVKRYRTAEEEHSRSRTFGRGPSKPSCSAFLHGTTRMRTQVEVEPGHRHAWVRRRAVANRRLQVGNRHRNLCLSAGRTDQLSRDGRASGGGTATRRQGDRRGAPLRPRRGWTIHRIFALAREFDVDIDIHLDVGNSPEAMNIHLVRELTEQVPARRSRRGRALGQAVALAARSGGGAGAPFWRTAGIAVTVLPTTDLFLMGRDQDHNIRRGVADANLLDRPRRATARCRPTTFSIRATPYGDCSLIRVANLYANVLQLDRPARACPECFDHADHALGTWCSISRDYGFVVGAPADVVIVNAQSPEQAIAEIAQPLAVFKNGRQTVAWQLPKLLRPH